MPDNALRGVETRGRRGRSAHEGETTACDVPSTGSDRLQGPPGLRSRRVDPLAHPALANANGFTDGLRRLPTQDHLDHSLSTKRRQAGILVDVDSALPRNS